MANSMENIRCLYQLLLIELTTAAICGKLNRMGVYEGVYPYIIGGNIDLSHSF